MTTSTALLVVLVHALAAAQDAPVAPDASATPPVADVDDAGPATTPDAATDAPPVDAQSEAGTPPESSSDVKPPDSLDAQSGSAQSGSAQRVDPCLALLRDGKREEARVCWNEAARRDDDNARIARELADLVGAMQLEEPGDLSAPNAHSKSANDIVESVDFGRLVLEGKAELVATSTLIGGYMGVLGTGFVMAATDNFGFTPAASALYLLSPVVMGGAGLAASAALVVTFDEITTGDANAARAMMLLGTYDSVMFAVNMAIASSTSTGELIPGAMLLLQVAGVGGGVAVAALTDLPEGAGSMALSGALWGSVLTGFTVQAFQLGKERPTNLPTAIAIAGNVGFATGMLSSLVVPMTRAETWGIDIGGGIGLLGGVALATYAKAPNPFIGWGTIAAGTAVGMAGGFATVRYVPELFEQLPEIVAVAPFSLDDGGAGALVLGRF